MILYSQLPSSWTLTTLGKVLYRSDLRVDPSTRDRNTFYIGLENLESNTGRLVVKPTISEEVLRSTKNAFYRGDILYGKLRPYLNKVYLAEKDGICSTDIWVFRVLPVINTEYVAFYLRSSAVVQQIAQLATGANLPRVSATAFDEIAIPLPSLQEQLRIVTILREAERLRQLRREADEKAQQILPALFYEMFGDPATNPKGWEVTTLDNICDRITDGTHQPPFFTEEGIPFLFVSNIINGEVDLNTDKHISRETYEILMKRCPVEQGDILYSTVGSYGVAVVVETDEPFAFQRHIAQIKPNRTLVDPFFLRSILNSDHVKAQADQRVRGIAQGTLNLGEIAEFIFYRPPLDLQQEFTKRVKVYQKTQDRLKMRTQSLDTLFQSLLAQAFTGELTASWRVNHPELLERREKGRDTGLFVGDIEQVESFLEGYEGEEVAEDEEALIVDVPNVARPELLRVLSKEQQLLFQHIQQLDGYCTQETLLNYYKQEVQPGDKLYNLPLYAIRQGLRLFVQAGLVQTVSLPDRPVREIVYVPAYRRLIEHDRARERDLDMLREKVEQEILQ